MFFDACFRHISGASKSRFLRFKSSEKDIIDPSTHKTWMRKRQIAAVVFPLSREHILRFIKGGKSVFIKFLQHESIPNNIRPGIKCVFYETGTGLGMTAEASIKEVGMMLPSDIIDKYGLQLFLTKEELERYATDRENKHMLVLQVEGPRKYETARRPPRPVSLSGLYLSDDEYESLFGKGSQR